MNQLIFIADPNLIDATTRFYYYLSRSEIVQLEILNINGKRMALLEEGRQAAGHHLVYWSASNLVDGIYLVRFCVGEDSITQNISLIRQENAV